MVDYLTDASRRVVATHLAMFKDSCVVSAVEAWRIWNDFPDQRLSSEMQKPLQHYGRVDLVLADISIVMSHLISSPNGMLDDAFLLQHVATCCSVGGESTFLGLAVLSSLLIKYGHHALYADYGRAFTNGLSTRCGYCRCGRCESITFMTDLGAYISRRRMSAL